MYAFGTIVLARFPFTDLSGSKFRPALVVPKALAADDLILCFMTSVPRVGPAIAPMSPDAENGLKQPSAVRFDKIATLNLQVIAGMIGVASASWLSANARRFQDVFGFATATAQGVDPNAG